MRTASFARSTPVAVSNLSNAAQLTLGSQHTCARLSDGNVQCWGYNANGQLGDGTNRTVPTGTKL
ncbi:MAG TPA: RCC1 domain-containing protein [Myxococcales bacterium]